MRATWCSSDLPDLVKQLSEPRAVWVMLPVGENAENTVHGPTSPVALNKVILQTLDKNRVCDTD